MYFLKSNFLKGSILIFVSNIFAQILNILSLFIVTYLYGIKNFGLFYLFMNYAILISNILTLKYEALLIRLPSFGRKVLVKYNIYILLIIFFFEWFNFQLFLKKNILFYSIEAANFLTIYKYIYNYLLASKKFHSIFLLKISNSMLFAILSLCLSHLFMERGLIYAYIFTYLFIDGIFLIFLWKEIKFFKISRREFIFLFRILRYYKDFPIYYLPQQLLNTFSMQLPIYFISYFFGYFFVGIYALVERFIFSLPSMIANAVSQVFYQQLLEVCPGKNCFKFFKKTFLYLNIISLALLSILIVGTFFVKNFLKPSIQQYFLFSALVLTPMVTLRFLGSSLSITILVALAQKKAFYIEIIQFIIRIIFLSIGGIIGNFKIFILLLSAVNIIITSFRIIWYFLLIRKVTKE